MEVWLFKPLSTTESVATNVVSEGILLETTVIRLNVFFYPQTTMFCTQIRQGITSFFHQFNGMSAEEYSTHSLDLLTRD